jgi:hypothetical protein
LGHACKNLGGLGPLVYEEIETAQTVHKGLAKLLYRYVCIGGDGMNKVECWIRITLRSVSKFENFEPRAHFQMSFGTGIIYDE